MKMNSNHSEKTVINPEGLSLWTESFGSPRSKPILLIMGAMNQGLFWPLEFCERLAAAAFYVIRYDNRDTGRSSIVDFKLNPYTLSEMTGDAIAILDSYGIEASNIMGLSMGGYIAQILAAENPKRTKKLILLSTTADHRPYMTATTGGAVSGSELPPPKQSYIDYINYSSANPPKSADEAERMILDGWRATHGGSSPFDATGMLSMIREANSRTVDPSAAFHHAFAVAASPPRVSLIRNISSPALVIHGIDDPCLPLPHGQFLADTIPNARLLTLDMGHMFPPSMSGEISKSVIQFLNE